MSRFGSPVNDERVTVVGFARTPIAAELGGIPLSRSDWYLICTIEEDLEPPGDLASSSLRATETVTDAHAVRRDQYSSQRSLDQHIDLHAARLSVHFKRMRAFRIGRVRHTFVDAENDLHEGCGRGTIVL